MFFIGASLSCQSSQSPGVSRPSSPVPPIACRHDPLAARDSVDTRNRFCVIDVGSRNVKFVIASIEGKDASSIRDENQCYARLRLGEKILDPLKKFPLALQDLDTEALVRIMTQYIQICEKQGGTMRGAIASEWARQAKNPEQILNQVKTRTGMTLDILPREKEGRYGYIAATRGTPGKIVLDLGSRSMQVSYWPRGASGPDSVSLPLGIDEAASRFFDDADHRGYPATRAAFIAATGPLLGPTLLKIRAELDKGKLDKEIISLGENGDVVMALQGKLWDETTRKGIDEPTYAALIKYFTPTQTETHGPVTGFVKAADVGAVASKLDQDTDLVTSLKAGDIKNVYGSKILVFPPVMSMLAKELGIESLVLVPQEMPDGLILDSLSR